jgi:hypothetical protein
MFVKNYLTETIRLYPSLGRRNACFIYEKKYLRGTILQCQEETIRGSGGYM